MTHHTTRLKRTVFPRRNVLTAMTFGLCMATIACQDTAPLETQDNAHSTYYLVRHAEKVLDVKDPLLTHEGTKRAIDLATRLEEVKLSKIYSTDTQRTRDTAHPTATAQGLEITLYDASNLEDFATQLKSETGHILIVGHSNTTPDLAKYLGGVSGKPIVEATEYDRFYIIKHHASEDASLSVTTKLERFGTPSPTE